MNHDRPNILFIIAHDLGKWLGCYGAPIQTPNLDQLARQGVRFERAFCTAAQCSPSRGSITTGLSPHANGLMGLTHMGWSIREGIPTLPQRMNDLGYATHLFGMQHEGDPVARLKYQHVHKTGGRAQMGLGGFADWVRSGAADDGPWFVSIGTTEPHRSFEVEQFSLTPDDPADVTLPRWLPDDEHLRRDTAGLNALVRELDRSAGLALAALDETGLRRNTLVVFTTDHGLAMPRAKGACYDPGIEVALLAQLPSRIDGGRVVTDLVSHMDVSPTLVAVAGGEAPRDLEGVSFRALLEGTGPGRRDHVVSEMTYHAFYNPLRSIRTDRWKYIRNFTDRPRAHVPGDVMAGHAGASSFTKDLVTGTRPAEELYDLGADPLEQHNLADDPQHAATLKGFRGRVDRWMRDTNDPLLAGFVDAPQAQREHAAKIRAQQDGLAGYALPQPAPISP